jgi:hypothetical protein
MTDPSLFLVDFQDQPRWWRYYRFPNGRTVSVIVDPRPHLPFRFEVEYDDLNGMVTASGLSTGEVETKLASVAALPATDTAA